MKDRLGMGKETYATPGADPFVVVVEVDGEGLPAPAAALDDETGVGDVEEGGEEDGDG